MKSLLNKTLEMSNLLENTLQNSENATEIVLLQQKMDKNKSRIRKNRQFYRI